MECKGFWNMCACPACRAADRDLAQTLDGLCIEERKKLIDQKAEEFEKERGIK